MTAGEQLRFMFTTLHSGAVNRTLHLASLPIIITGLIRRQPAWVLIGALMEVAGHVYNILFRFNSTERRAAWRVLPLQLTLSIVVFAGLFAAFGWL